MTPLGSRTRTPAGWTLTELLVAVAVFGIVATALMALVLSAQRSWASGTSQLVLTTELRRGLDRMSRELVESAVAQVRQLPVTGAWAAQMDFRVPQDRTGDGSVLDATGAIVEWSDWVTYQRGPNNQCQRVVTPAGGAAATEVVAARITALQFRHVLDAGTGQPSGTIEIQMTASAINEYGEVVSRTMGTRVRVRN